MMSRQKFDWSGWNPKEKAVLVFVWDKGKDQVLLIHKLRGLGQGKINVPGGRLDPGEDWMQAAVRETREETLLDIAQLEECAEHRFQFTDGYSLLVKAFLAYSWKGIPTRTPEADPFWCPRAEIPYAKMWSDDPIWVPRIFEGHVVKGSWLFDADTMLGATVSWDFPPGPG